MIRALNERLGIPADILPGRFRRKFIRSIENDFRYERWSAAAGFPKLAAGSDFLSEARGFALPAIGVPT